MYTGGDPTRFLGMWLVDSSHRNVVARVLPGRGKTDIDRYLLHEIVMILLLAAILVA